MSKMWFGTTDYMQWIDAPRVGADMSSTGWESTGTLLNGGGYAFGSNSSHKTYVFQWKDASAPRAAQTMKSYADGSFGRGLLYFIDPLIYGLNILPARYADPSMACDYEGGSMVYGNTPTRVDNGGWQSAGIPKHGAYYDLANTPVGFRGREEALFVPVPPGYSIRFGAVYDFTGSGGIFVTPHGSNGLPGTTHTKLTAASTASADKVTSGTFSGVPGVWLWLGKTDATASTVTARALVARLIKDGSTTAEVAAITNEPWIGGMGHSGCRFQGKPTYVANGGTGGGQVGYAATLIETGSWAYG